VLTEPACPNGPNAITGGTAVGKTGFEELALPSPRLGNCLGGAVVGTVARGVPSSAITILLYLLGYVFLLIVGLIVVNVVLTRRTREEREAERRRRRRVP
jgi:hypothetical protein